MTLVQIMHGLLARCIWRVVPTWYVLTAGQLFADHEWGGGGGISTRRSKSSYAAVYCAVGVSSNLTAHGKAVMADEDETECFCQPLKSHRDNTGTWHTYPRTDQSACQSRVMLKACM